MKKIDVHKIEMSSPDDTRGLKSLIDEGVVDPKTIIAVLGKNRRQRLRERLHARSFDHRVQIAHC